MTICSLFHISSLFETRFYLINVFLCCSCSRFSHECKFTAGVSYLLSGRAIVIIGFDNVLSPFGAKPLPNPLLTDGQIGILKPQLELIFWRFSTFSTTYIT